MQSIISIWDCIINILLKYILSMNICHENGNITKYFRKDNMPQNGAINPQIYSEDLYHNSGIKITKRNVEIWSDNRYK